MRLFRNQRMMKTISFFNVLHHEMQAAKLLGSKGGGFIVFSSIVFRTSLVWGGGGSVLVFVLVCITLCPF